MSGNRHTSGWKALLSLTLIAGIAGAARANVSEVIGIWELESQGSNGQTYAFALSVNPIPGVGLSGKITSERGESDLEYIRYDNGRLTFGMQFTSPNSGQSVKLDYVAKTTGGALKGDGTYAFGDNTGGFTFTGKRVFSGTAADVVGTWTIESTFGDQTSTSTLIIGESGGKLTATGIGEQGERQAESVTYVDGKLTLNFKFEAQGQSFAVSAIGEPRNDKIDGKYSFDFPGAPEAARSATFKGERIAKPKPTATGVDGTWNLRIVLPDGRVMEPKLKIRDERGKLVGEYESSQFPAIAISDAKASGNKLTFALKPEFNGNTFSFDYDLTVTGDTLKGTVGFEYEGQPGTLPVEGKRGS